MVKQGGIFEANYGKPMWNTEENYNKASGTDISTCPDK